MAMAATFEKLSSWNGGFEGRITIPGSATADVTGWTLEFKYPGAFTWLADAKVSQNDGWIMRPMQWTQVIPRGGKLEIRFGGTVGDLTDFKLNVVGSQAPGSAAPGSAAPPAPKSAPIPIHAPAALRWPPRYVCPYSDVSLWPTPDLASISRATGLRYFTLAFVVAGQGNVPSWGGVQPISDGFMMDSIRELRTSCGGDVCISFGGANGSELASVIQDLDLLVAAYQSVIAAYDCYRLDFDIEGAACEDRPSIVRRNAALARLQAAHKGRLRLSYTLPVMRTGLTSGGLYVLQSAKQSKVALECVRVMCMDYGPAIRDMGAAAISAATHTHQQLRRIEVKAPVGVIPMIGQNDVQNEVFDVPAAQKLLHWARATPWVKMLSWWSVARDKTGTSPGQAVADGSGIPQQPWEFAKVFGQFEG